MKKHKKNILAAILAGSKLLASLTFIIDAATLEFAIPWYAIVSGGSLATNGEYALNSIIGQSATGTAEAGRFALAIGFSPCNPAVAKYRVYLPTILR